MWKVEKEGDRHGSPQTRSEDGTWRLMSLTVFEKHLTKDGKEGGNDAAAPFSTESQECVPMCVCGGGGCSVTLSRSRPHLCLDPLDLTQT